MKINILKIIITNYFVFVSLLLSIFGIFLGWYVVGIWVICIPIVIFRTRGIIFKLNKGVPTNALITITRYNPFGAAWFLEYEYMIDNKKIVSNDLVVAFKLPFQVNDYAVARVDPSMPENSILEKIYS